MFFFFHRVVLPPTKMIVVPKHCYCVVENPVKKDTCGNIVKGKHGEVLLRFGYEETRLSQEPFPLYPGETLLKVII